MNPSPPPTTTKWHPTICIDFDGVIHSYEHGWQKGTIYGHVVRGFFEWATVAKRQFQLTIYSSRSKDPTGTIDMAQWLEEHLSEWKLTNPTSDLNLLDFVWAHEKPAAYLTIDDRAICFAGDWSAPALSIRGMQNFRPWYQS